MPKEVTLKNGTKVYRFSFMCQGFRMVVYARTQREAIKRAERLWGKGVPIPQFPD